MRLMEVTMKFWKVFHVEVPEGTTEEDVLGTLLVEDESRHHGLSEVDLEHDETTVKDEGDKTEDEIKRLKNHEKVFSWKSANGDNE